jgi:hypothetical protein
MNPMQDKSPGSVEYMLYTSTVTLSLKDTHGVSIMCEVSAMSRPTPESYGSWLIWPQQDTRSMRSSHSFFISTLGCLYSTSFLCDSQDIVPHFSADAVDASVPAGARYSYSLGRCLVPPAHPGSSSSGTLNVTVTLSSYGFEIGRTWALINTSKPYINVSCRGL